MKRTILLVIVAVVVGGGVVYVFTTKRVQAPAPEEVPTVLSYADCLTAGYPITEGSPRQCRTPDGRVYAEVLVVTPTYTKASADLIRVTLPHPGAVTGKTFTITGEARGTWYFEASFPIEIRRKDGTVLTTVVAQAQAPWMTQNFVPFTAPVSVPASYTGPATIVLKKDNPSGLPENDASMSFPITIAY